MGKPTIWGGGGRQYAGFRLENDLASKLPAKVPIFFYQGYQKFVGLLWSRVYRDDLISRPVPKFPSPSLLPQTINTSIYR